MSRWTIQYQTLLNPPLCFLRATRVKNLFFCCFLGAHYDIRFCCIRPMCVLVGHMFRTSVFTSVVIYVHIMIYFEESGPYFFARPSVEILCCYFCCCCLGTQYDIRLCWIWPLHFLAGQVFRTSIVTSVVVVWVHIMTSYFGESGPGFVAGHLLWTSVFTSVVIYVHIIKSYF